MKVALIPEHEESFFRHKDSAFDSYALERKTLQIKNNYEKITFIKCRTTENSFYFKNRTEKTQIVLHFTEGYLKGDIKKLTKPDHHISVPFLIARNGNILNFWDPSFWSYHLGITEETNVKPLYHNTFCCKKTIAIEISNISHLILKGCNLMSSHENENGEYYDIYCSINQQEYYKKTSTEFRGQKYFATCTKEQYNSLIILL